MMAVIKQAVKDGGVRPLGQPALVPASSVDPRDVVIACLRGELEGATIERDAARQAMEQAATAAREQLAAAVIKARDDALAEGRRAGLAEAQSGEDDRVAAMARGIADAAARFGDRLDALDGFAALLARTCLDRMFARPDAMADMVTDALRHRMAMLRDEAAVAVRVSGRDFTDTTPIVAVVREAGARAMIAIDPDLPAGACRISVRLAQIDIDVPEQWATLADVLDGLARA